MLIKSLVPPSNHIQQQAKNSPRPKSVNFQQLVLTVSKIWRFRDLRTRAKAQYLKISVEQKRYSVSI